MTHTATPVAVAVALIAAFLSTPPASAAQATPHPARPQRGVQQKVSHVDIDGDGRGDLTTLTLVSARGDNYGLRLTVRTAKGQVASIPVSTTNDGPLDFSCVWPITSGFDGVLGNEIALNPYGCFGDGLSLRVITWRKGKLVTVAGPGQRPSLPWTTNAVSDIYGYTFSMVGASRHVTYHYVRPSPSRRTYSGTDTSYRWSPTGWTKVKTTKIGPMSQNAAWKLEGFRGLIRR